MPPVPAFVKHPRETREICGEAGVCLVEMLPHPMPPTLQLPLLVLLLRCSCPQLSGKWVWAQGSSSGGRSGIWYVFEPRPFCPNSENRQPVGPLCAVFGWGLGWGLSRGPQRETLRRRWLGTACCSVLGIGCSQSGPGGGKKAVEVSKSSYLNISRRNWRFLALKKIREMAIL